MDLETSIDCPACKSEVKVKIKEMVPGKKKACPRCGAEITFAGDDGRKTQKAIDNLRSQFKKVLK
jgi:uncharacterized paraquat-inducible protein A